MAITAEDDSFGGTRHDLPESYQRPNGTEKPLEPPLKTTIISDNDLVLDAKPQKNNPKLIDNSINSRDPGPA